MYIKYDSPELSRLMIRAGTYSYATWAAACCQELAPLHCCVYLIHFHTTLKHAQHYLGFSLNGLTGRIQTHLRGNGSRLMNAVILNNINFDVVRAWPTADQRDGLRLETLLKSQHNTKKLCPVCTEDIGEYYAGLHYETIINATACFAISLEHEYASPYVPQFAQIAA